MYGSQSPVSERFSHSLTLSITTVAHGDVPTFRLWAVSRTEGNAIGAMFSEVFFF